MRAPRVPSPARRVGPAARATTRPSGQATVTPTNSYRGSEIVPQHRDRRARAGRARRDDVLGAKHLMLPARPMVRGRLARIPRLCHGFPESWCSWRYTRGGNLPDPWPVTIKVKNRVAAMLAKLHAEFTKSTVAVQRQPLVEGKNADVGRRRLGHAPHRAAPRPRPRQLRLARRMSLAGAGASARRETHLSAAKTCMDVGCATPLASPVRPAGRRSRNQGRPLAVASPSGASAAAAR